MLRWFRVRRAWERKQWERVVDLLEALVRERQSTDGDRVMLAHAYTKQGRLEQAAWYFEAVSEDEPLSKDETIAYCNSYAYVLARRGRLKDAKTHVRRFDRRRWPKAEREWAKVLLDATSPPVAPPGGKGPHKRIFH